MNKIKIIENIPLKVFFFSWCCCCVALNKKKILIFLFECNFLDHNTCGTSKGTHFNVHAQTRCFIVATSFPPSAHRHFGALLVVSARRNRGSFDLANNSCFQRALRPYSYGSLRYNTHLISLHISTDLVYVALISSHGYGVELPCTTQSSCLVLIIRFFFNIFLLHQGDLRLCIRMRVCDIRSVWIIRSVWSSVSCACGGLAIS